MTVLVVHAHAQPLWLDHGVIDPGVEVRTASNVDELREVIVGADVLFGFDWKGKQLPQVFDLATDLRWIQWAGAGVDALLFDELVASDVVVTNAGGVYDESIAEHVLALILGLARGIPTAVRKQLSRTWEHRLTQRLAGSRATVVGAGGIGRAIARSLLANGVEVQLCGTRTRQEDEFGTVTAWADRDLSTTDWLVMAAPLTEASRGMISSEALAELPPTAHFINIGRGESVDETALIDALAAGGLAGAGLDVFATEPLPETSPLWAMNNVIITPHHAGDDADFSQRVVDVFIDNLGRYRSGRPLHNVVDKRLGYRAS